MLEYVIRHAAVRARPNNPSYMVFSLNTFCCSHFEMQKLTQKYEAGKRTVFSDALFRDYSLWWLVYCRLEKCTFVLENRSRETKQKELGPEERLSWQSLGLQGSRSIRSDSLECSLHSPVINLRLCHLKSFWLWREICGFIVNVADGSCGLCDPAVSR